MGTRSLTCICHNGVYKLANYAQWDGYPSGMGRDILRFLNTHNVLDKFFVMKVDAIRMLRDDECEKFLNKIEAVAKTFDVDITSICPQLSRDVGADILTYISNSNAFGAGLVTMDSLNFAADSCICEYAYVLDLDKQTFEVYEGFNTQRLADGERFARFNDMAEQQHAKEIEEGFDGECYYPVKLVRAYSLNVLPTEEQFLKDFEKEED